MLYDRSFCSNIKCEDKKCFRNQNNYDFDRLEDTKEANFMMKRLSLMFAANIKEDENLEICNGNE